ncbi:MAG: FadR family transcriptional regulator [Rhodobacteraceae bacterium]|nr:FadR family transcriptional regulator [Paracoccaceae bacterium]
MTKRAQAIGTPDSLPQRVVALISRDIASGALAPGSRLPTEQRLAAQLGVSRNVVREAIAQLRADGLVEARQGVGAFVLAPEQRAAVRFDREALADPGNMEQLFELRSVLETEAARLAARRRTPDQLAAIRAHLARMEGAERWGEGSIDADLAFHREIAAATGNGYIHSLISLVCEQIRQSIHVARQTNPLHDLVAVNLAEHERICAALTAGDGDASAAAMGRHIHGAAERVGVRLADDAAADRANSARREGGR